MFVTRLLASACAVFVFSAPAFASTVTVTSPSGLSTANGTPAYNTWYADDMRAGGAAGITNAYAYGGNGSLQFTQSAGSDPKTDFAYYFGGNSFALSTLGSFSYDFYRNSDSTINAILDPALRLAITYTTSDGKSHFGSLVYEPAYNTSSSDQTSATNQFVAADAYAGKFWGSGDASTPGTLASTPGAFTRTLQQWQDTAGISNLTVVGITTGTGSGWNGSGFFDGAVDNISYGLTDGTSTTFNFETPNVSATPEPGSIFLLGTGLLSVGGAALRRRKFEKN